MASGLEFYSGGFVDDSAFFCETMLPHPCIIKDCQHLSDWRAVCNGLFILYFKEKGKD